MREQGVDQAGFRGEVAAQDRRPALVAGDFVEQALKLGDIPVDRLLEVAVGAVLSGDLVERLLAGRGVEPFGKGLALAALITVLPEVEFRVGVVVESLASWLQQRTGTWASPHDDARARLPSVEPDPAHTRGECHAPAQASSTS